jgi:peptidoglycan hydrolase-like protein with peptidoglycan-binding domain
MNSGIQAIDDLVGGTGSPIAPGSDAAAIGAIQDLLRGQGFARMPGLRESSRGKYGKNTIKAVAAFRRKHGLPDDTKVDQQTLLKLIQIPASNPIVSQAYVTLVLNITFTQIVRLVSLVAIVEGAGKFAALCLNTDHAGLSVGIIQWAQKPKRLNELIDAMETNQATATEAAFGGSTNVTGLLTFTGGSNGGVKADGTTTDSKFDLIRDPWKTRFKNACLDPTLQAVQVTAAADAFTNSATKIKTNMPKITTERQVAFTLDLANQFGDGGAQKIYNAVEGGITDPIALLEAMRDASVEKLTNKFPDLPQIAQAGADRRNFFITTDLLTDNPF